MPEDKFGFGNIIEEAARLKKNLPIVIANEAKNFFTRSFTAQGWDGAGWPEVNRRTPGTSEYKYPKFKDLSRRTTPILVRSGRLRRGVSNSVRIATWERIMLSVEAPGAQRHNEGLDGMPKRTFMANSPVLDMLIEKKIVEYVNKIWR